MCSTVEFTMWKYGDEDRDDRQCNFKLFDDGQEDGDKC